MSVMEIWVDGGVVVNSLARLGSAVTGFQMGLLQTSMNISLHHKVHRRTPEYMLQTARDSSAQRRL